MDKVEDWKDIEFFEGYYQVSNKGRVRALERKAWLPQCKSYRIFPSRLIALSVDKKTGYVWCHLFKKGIQRRCLVHRLVAKAFIPNPENLPQINHINELKTDNNIENLEWCTARYNTNYGSCIEKRMASQRKKVKQLTLDDKYIRTFPSVTAVVKELGFSSGAICNCCNNKLRTAYGFKWEYV